MANKRIGESDSIPKEYLDVTKWISVNTEGLTAEKREVFLRRKQAIDMYITTDIGLKEISNETGIAITDIYRLTKRCISLDEAGELWGYRALIPYLRTRRYERQKETGGKVKLTGAFERLLETYPLIKTMIDDSIFGRNIDQITDPKMRTKFIHKKFIQACRKEGLKPSDYPFNSENAGKRTLYRYVFQTKNKHFIQAAALYGDDAAQKARSTGSSTPAERIRRPFQRVEFDGHRIDMLATIVFHTLDGDEVVKIIDRFWLLAIIDVASRVTLGYSISFQKQYSANDVLQCIRNAVEPWTPKEFTISGLKYPNVGGFHSQVIPSLEWAVWDELKFDNAQGNLAPIVMEKLKSIIGCSVNPGLVNTPIGRPFIERLFQTLEEYGYHRCPSTTGSGPKDPRREGAEENAIKYRISADHILELTEVLIAQYNGTPHSSLMGLTPLEVMEQRIDKKMPIRILSEEKRNAILYLSKQVERTVRGSVKTGRHPYVEYEGATYSNEVLARSPNLIGVKLTLFVNIEDARNLRAFLPDGSGFGYLTAKGQWGILPHTLQLRKELITLRYRKIIQFNDQDDFIDVYNNYLLTKSKASKTARSKLEQLRQEQKRNQARTNNFQQVENKSEIKEVVNTANEVATTSTSKFDNNKVVPLKRSPKKFTAYVE